VSTLDSLQRHRSSEFRLDAPTAARCRWFEERYEYLLHDRDSIFAKHFDESIGRLGSQGVEITAIRGISAF